MNKIICGDSLEVLQTLDSESIDCCVTSPPYWGLRDYGDEEQLGLEPTFDEYINKLCNIFDEVQRVLKSEGTCWVNLGDSYSSQGGPEPEQTIRSNKENYVNRGQNDGKSRKPVSGTLAKSLCLIPQRFAIEMTNRGWICRNEIIWHKPSCMPSSAKDRFTVDFEYLFFFVKNQNYYFEQQFDKYTQPLNRWGGVKFNDIEDTKYEGLITNYNRAGKSVRPNPEGRNKRCVWSINTQPNPDAHFASFPEELIFTPIIAGCPVGGMVLDPFVGTGTTCRVAKDNNRNYLGIDLNPEYCQISVKNLRQEVLAFV